MEMILLSVVLWLMRWGFLSGGRIFSAFNAAGLLSKSSAKPETGLGGSCAAGTRKSMWEGLVNSWTTVRRVESGRVS